MLVTKTTCKGEARVLGTVHFPAGVLIVEINKKIQTPQFLSYAHVSQIPSPYFTMTYQLQYKCVLEAKKCMSGGLIVTCLTFWRRIFFFQILAHPVFKM